MQTRVALLVPIVGLALCLHSPPAAAKDCPTGYRCHALGAFYKFGNISASTVRAAQSSIVMIKDSGSGEPCSGVLVAPNAILTAAHCLPTANPTKYVVIPHYACKSTSAPTGKFAGADGKKESLGCYKINRKAKGRIRGFMKLSKTLDLALVYVRWFGEAKMPAPTYPATTGSIGGVKHVFAMGYPLGQAVQASGGWITRLFVKGPYGRTGTESYYASANYASVNGMSGGGIFDQRGRLVGILCGRNKHGSNFLVLSRMAAKSKIIRNLMQQGSAYTKTYYRYEGGQKKTFRVKHQTLRW